MVPRYRSPCPRSSMRVPDGSPVGRSLIAAGLLSHLINPAGAGTRRLTERPPGRRHLAVNIEAYTVGKLAPSGAAVASAVEPDWGVPNIVKASLRRRQVSVTTNL